jgi:hypothetical protein
MVLYRILVSKMCRGHLQGRIQDFKSGGTHLKKLRRTEGGAKMFGVFRVKKSRFYAKKIIFFQILGGGGTRRVRHPHPPVDPPLTYAGMRKENLNIT